MREIKISDEAYDALLSVTPIYGMFSDTIIELVENNEKFLRMEMQ